MPQTVYRYVDVVRLAHDACQARIPQMQKSAIDEFCENISHEVTAGKWTANGSDNALNAEGQDVERYLDICISTRPHWLIPEVVTVASDDTWTSGNLTKQAARWKELFAVLGDKGATDRAMAEEAARYGTAVGLTKPGVVPGAAAPQSEKSDNRQNPYTLPLNDPRRQERIIALMRNPTLAANLAKSAGFTIDGRPLKR